MKKRLLSLSFDDLDREEWSAALRQALSEDGVCFLYTPNAEIAFRAEEDEAFRALLGRADYLSPDGDGVVLGAALWGNPLSHGKRAGVELGEEIARLCAEEGRGLFLYGGREGVAEEAANALRARYPSLSVVGTACGYGEGGKAVADRIRACGAEAALVCLGSPRQEEWIDRYGGESGARLLAGLGGSLDVYAGRTKRAPRVLRALRAEWLWRTACDPRRIGRLGAIPRFLLLCLRNRGKGEKG